MTSTLDVATQIDIGVRLLLATILGGAIGFEREVHDHPAGVRTHLLVCLGSAMFTVVSVYGFVSDPGAGNVDPTRIAAQIVSGIGFLGAGAIIKYGTSIFGLTTAGSLWATAAVGMAAGAGMPLVSIMGAGIVLFSLWPLHRIVSVGRGGDELLRVRLRLRGLEPLGRVTTELARMHAELVEVASERTAKNRYEVRLSIRPRAGSPPDAVIAHLMSIADVELVDAAAPGASSADADPGGTEARPGAAGGGSAGASGAEPRVAERA